ncbi:cholesterol transport system auxiliary component [Modicisalibacter ilicicola DSM 19980]|uniref:Cholesterol transport system auxiliary component n=1 Tax=Modicisalibacter ilicicola DSM 19980 TaxID=1121942 RepID=A0A1M5AVT9_9GAMM|nr:ABC-type transport auxiliary lipoprotein family protein [Halomonas ilicicola]SHF34330.1 cholesterol transport system auxiliary component [Halomonas ilicicola DSM 19980]
MSSSNVGLGPRAASWRLLALTILLSSLAACTLLPATKPLQTFVLPAGSSTPSDDAPLNATLRLATPRSNEILKNRRILVMPAPNQLNVYQGARWSTDAPSLLRDRLTEAFRQNGRLSGVIGGSNQIKSDFVLLSELDAFHSEYAAGAPWAVIRLEAQLVDSASRNLLASQYFTIRVKSEDERLESVVEAFGRAADELSQRLVGWSLAYLGDHIES